MLFEAGRYIVQWTVIYRAQTYFIQEETVRPFLFCLRDILNSDAMISRIDGIKKDFPLFPQVGVMLYEKKESSLNNALRHAKRSLNRLRNYYNSWIQIRIRW